MPERIVDGHSQGQGLISKCILHSADFVGVAVAHEHLVFGVDHPVVVEVVEDEVAGVLPGGNAGG
ncbi:hypothetical protein D3C86_2054590 [compost metagenome]